MTEQFLESLTVIGTEQKINARINGADRMSNEVRYERCVLASAVGHVPFEELQEHKSGKGGPANDEHHDYDNGQL